MIKIKVALTGNWTPDSLVAGGNSTTKPPMLVTSPIFPAQSHIKYCIHVKNSRVAGENSTTEPPMLLTSPIFPAQSHIKHCIDVKNLSCIRRESNPGLQHGSREFYH